VHAYHFVYIKGIVHNYFITTTHRLTLPFQQGIFDQRQHSSGPQPTLLYLFIYLFILRLKMKLKDRHFDIIEVIDAVSQAVLNTLTDTTTSRMHFKTWQKLWERCIRAYVHTLLRE
jgi:hypothetical protein